MTTECTVASKNALTRENCQTTLPVFKPSVNVVESEESVVLTVDLPGVAEDDLDVTVENHILTIRGNVRPTNHEGMERIVSEYEVGNYERKFSISDKLDPDSIDATLKNGVLTISLFRLKELDPKKVTVRSI